MASLRAQNVSQILDQYIFSLQNKMGKGPSSLMAQNALKNQARIESFSIEAIARLFKKENKLFPGLKDLIKSFEDEMGEVNKWSSFLKMENISLSQKKIYEQNLNVALNNLSKFLSTSNFYLKLSQYRNSVAKLKISEASTKIIVISGIKDDIKDVMSNNYDFSEGEDGIHEFRRNLRWILYEIDAFKNFFQATKSSSCRNNKFYNLGLNSYYTSVLTSNSATSASFNLNFCPYAELSGAVVYLGQIKDQLEQQNKLQHKITSEISSQINEVYLDLVKNILPHLLKN